MKKRVVFYLSAAFLLILVTGCFQDILSWSPDGRYLSYIVPKNQRLWVWDSKMNVRTVVLDTSDTMNGIFLPKRFWAGQEMLVGRKGKESVMSNLSILRLKNGEKVSIADNIMNGNYDMGRKGWVYYITDSGQSGNQRHTLWGYNLRRNNSQRIYATGNEMFFPNSDSRGRILVYMEGKDKMIMEVDADKGTTRSIATFTENAWYPMWANKGKSLVYLGKGDKEDMGTLCRLNIESGTTESLMSNVIFTSRIQISRDGKSVVAAVAMGKGPKEKKEVKVGAKAKEEDKYAMARVNLKGIPSVEFLTPKDGKSLYGTLSPDGKRLAYCSGGRRG